MLTMGATLFLPVENHCLVPPNAVDRLMSRIAFHFGAETGGEPDACVIGPDVRSLEVTCAPSLLEMWRCCNDTHAVVALIPPRNSSISSALPKPFTTKQPGALNLLAEGQLERRLRWMERACLLLARRGGSLRSSNTSAIGRKADMPGACLKRAIDLFPTFPLAKQIRDRHGGTVTPGSCTHVTLRDVRA
jgi:hypothetical protein